MTKPSVLIIDDDKSIGKLLEGYFQYEGFEVALALNGREGFKKIEKDVPDIVILDNVLPELSGLEVCKKLRPQNQTPVIILSAKNEESDRISGLEHGADDYISKPFSPKEVVVRARAILRRVKNNQNRKERLSFKKLVIDKRYHQVLVYQESINVTPKEFDLLWFMSVNQNQAFSREELLKKVWGHSYFGDVRTVDTHIKSLRNKLGRDAANYVKTVWGIGYKFVSV